MNTNRTIKVRTAVVAAAFAIVASAGTPAYAEHGHEEAESGTRVAPFAVPIAALGGLTLAQYVEQHEAADQRLAVIDG
jgi:uncharacterized membrane protein YfcA